ncbi:MAG: DNA repair protein RecO [Calditrichia bacterium]
MISTVKTEALVVHSIRWSETSKIVHLFTEKIGSVKVLAKGALRPKSSFRGTLENLNHLEVVLNIRESRSLQHIHQAALLDSFSNIRDNLDATAEAFAILELIQKLLRFNEPGELLFRQTIGILQDLNRPGSNSAGFSHLLRYLLILTDYLGFSWEFGYCRGCGTVPGRFPLQVDVPTGAVYCRSCNPPQGAASVRLEYPQWELLRRLKAGSLQDAARNESAAAPLISLLLSHLNFHTEQSVQLKSLKMYRL